MPPFIYTRVPQATQPTQPTPPKMSSVHHTSAAPTPHGRVPSTKLVSDVDAIREVVESILEDFEKAPTTYTIAVDLEGANIGPKTGKLAIVTVAVPNGDVLLLDVATHGDEAFTKGGIKILLEHPHLPKLWFDIRTDTSALFPHGVKPAHIVDLQVGMMCHMAVGARRKPDYLSGLGKAMTMYNLPADMTLKERGLNMFAPERGGTYQVFFDRPMSDTMMQYCAADVYHLFSMHKQLKRYTEKMIQVADERITRFYNNTLPERSQRLRDMMVKVDFPL